MQAIRTLRPAVQVIGMPHPAGRLCVKGKRFRIEAAEDIVLPTPGPSGGKRLLCSD